MSCRSCTLSKPVKKKHLLHIRQTDRCRNTLRPSDVSEAQWRLHWMECWGLARQTSTVSSTITVFLGSEGRRRGVFVFVGYPTWSRGNPLKYTQRSGRFCKNGNSVAGLKQCFATGIGLKPTSANQANIVDSVLCLLYGLLYGSFSFLYGLYVYNA